MRAWRTGAVRHQAWQKASTQAAQKRPSSQSPRAGSASGSRRLATSTPAVAATMPVTVVTASASTTRLPAWPLAACCFLRFSTKKTKPVAMHTQPASPPAKYSTRSSQWRKCCRCRPVMKLLIPSTIAGGSSSRITSPVGPLKWMPSPVSVTRSVPARYTLTVALASPTWCTVSMPTSPAMPRAAQRR